MPRLPLPTCRAQYSDGPGRVRASVASPPARPSPFPRRVGVRVFTFEACSGFTHVTACRIARSPEATFVTRLQPGQLPKRAARQLPAQPTTRWVVPSSTGKPRQLGALGNTGLVSPTRLCVNVMPTQLKPSANPPRLPTRAIEQHRLQPGS